ncbi:helix-turn-helix domain-containing protein [Wukongibacter baidiensis]|uniref:helix-turn-helix domain-containing protein n=1 Tax=Wukongibacter baidiensis TaxID=1723361 RepID=UPI003D7FC1C6
MTLGEKIRLLRETKKMTHDDLAKLLNVGRSTISNYERNYRKPDIDMLKRIASVFNVTTDYLLGITENPNNKLTDEANKQLVDEIIEIYIKNGKIKKGEKLTKEQEKKILKEIELFVDMSSKLEDI